MLRLKRLELLGFKSFADRTRVELPEGTLAIVGPNGCGKSNLSDAMSWVLGEQSPRLLRGERMVDVIFNGTGNRLPTSMAEVSMTLFNPAAEENGQEIAFAGGGHSSVVLDLHLSVSDSPAKPAAKMAQVTVTRRLFRSGESEYLINGEIARLRDIQDLFMGTGLGPESYAIIEQGRIGQILSSKPSDRRLILEEAAGISKFKARKRASELKLESARANLARITDILLEVSKQVNSLKRQASKARRCKELQEELKARQKLLFASRVQTLEATRNRLNEELERLRAALEETGRELSRLEQEQKAATARSEKLEKESEALQQSLAQTALNRQRLESRIEQANQELIHLDGRATDAHAEMRRLDARRTALETEAAEHARRRDAIEQELNSARVESAGFKEQQDRISAQLAEAETALAAAREALLNALAEAAEMSNQLAQAEEMAQALDRQLSRASAERAAAEQGRDRVTKELETLISQNLSSEREHAALVETLSAVTTALEAARKEESTWREKLDALRQEFSAIRARRETLGEALARHAYTPEGVRRLLAGEDGANGNRFRPIGLLADFLEVAPGYEEAIEEFLKAELDCVVVEHHADARSGIALLRHEGAGRSMFFVMHAGTNGHSNGANDPAQREPGVVAPVRELVRFEPRLGLNGDLPLPSLARAYVVEDASSAERLAAVYPEHHFLTATGEHYHHRLVSGGKGPSAGPLALRRDFRALEQSATEIELQVRSAEKALAAATAETARQEEDLKTKTAAKLEAEKKTLLASEKVRQGREALQQATTRLEILESETAGLETERQNIQSRLGMLRPQLETVTAERSRQESAIHGYEQQSRELRAAFERGAGEQARLLARLSTLEERASASAAEGERFSLEMRDAVEQSQRLRDQVVAWAAQQDELRREISAAHERVAQFENDQRALQENRSRASEELQAARARRDALSPLLDAARSEFEGTRQKCSDAEVARARTESDCAHAARECREALGSEPAALLAELAPEALLAGEALEAASREALELKSRIESLGPLNMMALQELQEAEERYQFLETQRRDLLASIEDTTKAIREIDQVSRQQFMEAFRKINENFAESFRTLFGGGVGALRLADENDPESGLDIVAQPPGKRLQNVLLLSGGEKALAALALLIAIFRYAPSPFCILDEVDAPLDESNIDRFIRLIDRMSADTQFILITHNKRTMEIARTIYGVTMEEPGVSKLVSVKFDDVEKEALAVPA